MSDKYKIYDNSKAYFLTLTVVGWIDVLLVTITSKHFLIRCDTARKKKA